jgi:hypothetical protein
MISTEIPLCFEQNNYRSATRRMFRAKRLRFTTSARLPGCRVAELPKDRVTFHSTKQQRDHLQEKFICMFGFCSNTVLEMALCRKDLP